MPPVSHQMPRRRGSAAWTPTSDGSVLAWWRGDSFSGATWTDKTGNGHSASAVGTPTTTTLGGKTALNLSGGVYFNSGASNIITAGAAFTAAFAGRSLNNVGGALFTARQSTQYEGCLVLDVGGLGWTNQSLNYYGGDGSTSPANVQLTTAPGSLITAAGGFHIVWSFPASGSAPTVYINGTAFTTSSGVRITETGTTGFMIGTDSANQTWSGIFGDCAVFGRAFSAGDVVNWTSYAHSYWGI